MPLPTDRSANLWAVTCYFNPCGYRRRAFNYRIFRQRLQAPRNHFRDSVIFYRLASPPHLP
jgi:hypothetical protein